MNYKSVKQFSFFTFLVVMILSGNLMGQEKKSDIKSKLNSIKGNITSITITTNEGEIDFEGEEALLLFKRLKSRNFDLKILSLEEEADFEFFSESELSGAEGKMKKKLVKVETIDGETTVTVTTFKNGDKEVKVLEGEEAEKYLEKTESDGVKIKRFKVDGEESETCIIINDDGRKRKIKIDEIECHLSDADSDSTKFIIMKRKEKKE